MFIKQLLSVVDIDAMKAVRLTVIIWFKSSTYFDFITSEGQYVAVEEEKPFLQSMNVLLKGNS